MSECTYLCSGGIMLCAPRANIRTQTKQGAQRVSNKNPQRYVNYYYYYYFY